MAIDRTPNRGMFGYEGEGFDYAPEPRGYRDLENDRGWNIGHGDDRGARPSYRGRGPKNYQRPDDRIREDVCERLAEDHDVDATDIEVVVNGGVVVLSGSVQERFAKRMAEDLAESVRGVRDVENNIRVTR
jgi:osmotically-inducible protein OsmY